MSAPSIYVKLRRPLAVWLAVLIAFLGALAPSVSHALNAADHKSAGLVEVCTSTGPRWVALNQPPIQVQTQPQFITALADKTNQFQTDSPAGPESVSSSVHCPFCLLSTERAVPPPHAFLLHFFSVSGEQEKPTFEQAFLFFTDFAFTPPPRGPPLFS
jgi:hypothetical protein